MKTKKLFLLLLVMTTMMACSEKENSHIDNANLNAEASKNWQEAELNNSFYLHQKNLSHYSFTSAEISDALSKPNLRNFRFVLGLENDELTIDLVGIDDSGNEIVRVSPTHVFNSDDYSKSIDYMKDSPITYSSQRKQISIVGRHLLEYNDTYKYITAWNNAIESKSIDKLITDSGERFRYYSLEKEVVADMVSKNSVKSIALFLGVNSDNKLTTVFLQKDLNEQIITRDVTSRNGEDGDSYDLTTPCPNLCDDCGCPDGTRVWCWETCPDDSKPKKD